MWTKLAGFILRYRIALIVVVAVCTLFMGWQARNLEMSYEQASLLPQTDSSFIDFAEFQKKFGQEGGNVMVFAVEDPAFFQLDKVNDWLGTGREIRSLKGVSGVASITHTFNLRKNNERKSFEIASIFPDRVETRDELDSLSDVARNLPFYFSTLVVQDKPIYGMMVTVAAEVMNSPERVGLVREIEKITRRFTDKYELDMHYSGLPYIRVVNAENVKKEMYMFVVLSLLITAIILYLFFRSFRTVGFCLLIIGTAVVWAVGYMALLGIKITLLTAMLPSLLIVIGVPNSVFMINKYHSEYIRHGNKIKSLQRMIHKIGNATLLSNLTTATGFATFIITSSQILRDFGLISFMSITTIFVICLILIPAIFSFLPVPDKKQTKHLHNSLVNKIINTELKIVMTKRTRLYTCTVVVLLIGIIGMTLMKTTGYMVDDLKESDPIRQDLTFFEEHFDGLMPLEVTVDFQKPNQVLKQSNLEKLDRFCREMQENPDVSRPLSIVEVIKFANQAYYNGKPEYYCLPNSMTRNFILKYAQNSAGEIGGMANSFIDSTSREIRLSFRVKDIGTRRMEELEDSVYRSARRIFPPESHSVKVTGSSVIAFKGNRYLIENLFSSLALAIVLIAGFMAWMFRSKRMVLIALVPNIIPLIFTAAIMGFTGIPIKASTILVFSVAFGISTDDTIHYLAKYRQELQATKWDIRLSVVHALKETGQSMIYTSIILFFGFGIFCLSDFGGTFALGMLTSLTLLSATLANQLLLPALLLTMEKSITNRTFREPLLQIYNEEEDIDTDKLSIRPEEKE
ncbi:MAG: MMPL family transporter [Culturomica sp.]|nr:MMPL family transporter [Culturomica sp.]